MCFYINFSTGCNYNRRWLRKTLRMTKTRLVSPHRHTRDPAGQILLSPRRSPACTGRSTAVTGSPGWIRLSLLPCPSLSPYHPPRYPVKFMWRRTSGTPGQRWAHQGQSRRQLRKEQGRKNPIISPSPRRRSPMDTGHSRPHTALTPGARPSRPVPGAPPPHG